MTHQPTLLLLSLCILIVIGCNIESIDYEFDRPPRGIPIETRYNLSDIYDQLPRQDLGQFSDNIRTTLSCVEAVGETNIFGTPGGDFGEFILGLQSYSENRHVILTEDIIRSIFIAYVKDIASQNRKFYYHTSKFALNGLFASIPTNPKPTIMPMSEPPESERQFWYNSFILPEFQGCDLISGILLNSTRFGVPNKQIVEMTLKVFLQYWWNANVDDKAKILFEISLGVYEEQAICVITNEGPGCHGHTPMASANTRGSSVIIYHPLVVNDFRRQIVVPFFRRYDPNVETDSMNVVVRDKGQQFFEQMMSGVEPASGIAQFTVKVTISGSIDVLDTTSISGLTFWSFLVIGIVMMLFTMLAVGIFSFMFGRSKHNSKGIELKN
jgi:hypothetical protein